MCCAISWIESLWIERERSSVWSYYRPFAYLLNISEQVRAAGEENETGGNFATCSSYDLECTPSWQRPEPLGWSGNLLDLQRALEYPQRPLLDSLIISYAS
jgi:hypothetical protein